MSKRAPQFERQPQDFYATPFEAAVPVIPFLDGIQRYIEPCSGDGDLVSHLGALKPEMVCAFASDLRFGFDALTLKATDVVRYGADAIISNIPWKREIMHPLIEHLSTLTPTWLLFDADWMFTKQASGLLCRCSHIVAVGRVRWIRDSPHWGKDNAAWYRFHGQHSGPTRFYGRAP